MMRNKDLKAVLQNCGWPVSGIKSTLIERINSQLYQSRLTVLRCSKIGGLQQSKKQPKEHRILSLDLGIKNLAFCLLKISREQLTTDSKPNPEILAWKRFSLLDTSNGTVLDKQPEFQQNISFTEIDFSAHSLAPIATSLARQLVAVHKPTMIAIEKQRYRTMGSAAVQEWTLRVNTLEAMIHTALRMLLEEGVWKQGSTCSICPQRMTRFWLDRNNLSRKSRSGKASKLLKINLVRTLLQNEQTVTYDEKNDSVTEAVSLFTETGGRSKPDTNEKIDDLADCLLQGVGLIEWEKNRQILLEEWGDAKK
ncbi:hypothetical protein TWF694_002767 [Orbilia ellipsospora]|uniref:SAP domain-containing protein n=1 Tax=Orbilia ellipsospora TaxID=2528407 RepID=A0AAV9X0X4_9PEZI